MADAATLQLRLDEAEAALHKVTVGGQAVELRMAAGQVSRAVTFTPANAGELRAYIADLRRQLGQPTRRRAIGVVF